MLEILRMLTSDTGLILEIPALVSSDSLLEGELGGFSPFDTHSMTFRSHKGKSWRLGLRNTSRNSCTALSRHHFEAVPRIVNQPSSLYDRPIQTWETSWEP